MNIVIGAGISGLSFANFINDDNYIILEASNEIGGYCKTIKKDGFTWDYSGHFFHFQNKWLEELICKNIDKNDIVRCQKQTQIKYNDRYIDFPFQKNIHQLKKEEFIDCLYDLFNIEIQEFSNFKEMLYAKFGKSISEKFLIPYNEKLYACNLNKLDCNAMGRFFPYANKEEIIRNFKNTNNSSYNSHFTYPKNGAIEYINSLLENINPDKIRLQEKVVEINLKTKTVITNKRMIRYDNIISTIPFPNLLSYCKIDYNEQIYSWNKVLVFNLGFDKKGKDVKNHWVYFPNKELCFYRVGYYDNILSSDRMSLYVEIGFDKDKNSIDIERYKEQVLIDLKKANIIQNENLISYHYVLMDPAYVHITQESIEDVKLKKEQLENYNIYSIGRYGSWTYCSIEDNILEAKNIAEKLNNLVL